MTFLVSFSLNSQLTASKPLNKGPVFTSIRTVFDSLIFLFITVVPVIQWSHYSPPWQVVGVWGGLFQSLPESTWWGMELKEGGQQVLNAMGHTQCLACGELWEGHMEVSKHNFQKITNLIHLLTNIECQGGIPRLVTKWAYFSESNKTITSGVNFSIRQ